MEPPPNPKADPNALKDTTWLKFNPGRLHAAYDHSNDAGDLPPGVVAAITLVKRNVNGLQPDQVNWNVTCVAADGASVLQLAVNLEGGRRSGSTGCGEDELWSGIDKNAKSVPIPKASKVFVYKRIIYVIDGGLCPCLRCCAGLLELSRRTESIIIVRPMTDYEIISTSLTPLVLTNTYILVFTPTSNRFRLYYSSLTEAPAGTQPVVLIVDPAKAKCKCTNCNSIFNVTFTLLAVKADYIAANNVTTIPCPKPKCRGKYMLTADPAMRIEPKDEIKLTKKG